MPGKHRSWHEAWRRLPDGRLQHDSGLAFYVRQAGQDVRVDPDAGTLSAFHEAEAQRGMPLHDAPRRMQRLAREALFWYRDARNRA